MVEAIQPPVRTFTYEGFVLLDEEFGGLYSEKGDLPRFFAKRHWARYCVEMNKLDGYSILPCTITMKAKHEVFPGQEGRVA